MLILKARGILSTDRLVQKPGEAWGHIWIGMPIEFMEKAGTIPIDFFDALDGAKTILLKIEK